MPNQKRRLPVAATALLAGSIMLATVGAGALGTGCVEGRTNFEEGPETSLEDAASSADTSLPEEAAAPQEASSDAGISPSLLAGHLGCPLTMFAVGTVPQDFAGDGGGTVGAGWATQWAAPVPAPGGSLQFGPHPMTESWWENYSPITSTTKPGDVLVCARLRVALEAGGAADSNTFELTMRLPDGAQFETAGMALEIAPNRSSVGLRTRTAAASWETHDSRPFAITGPSTTLDVVLHGQGQQFFAEVRDIATGASAVLRATYTLPPGGAVSMLGWRQRSPWFVDRLVLGVPSQQVASQLAAMASAKN